MDELVEAITRRVLRELTAAEGGSASTGGRTREESGSLLPGRLYEGNKVVCGVSARHVHLSREHLAVLFGDGYELSPMRPLGQPGQFAAHETVAVVGPRGGFFSVRILGPTRSRTQVELSATDARTLGIDAPVRISGNTEGTPGAVLIGPRGVVTLDSGVIVAARHLHLDPGSADRLGLRDGDVVAIGAGVDGPRPVVFENVVVRSGPAHAAEAHFDTDEANAAGLRGGELVEILRRRRT